MKPRYFFCLFLSVVLFHFGCGYALVGRGGFWPEHIQTMAVPVFKNMTFQHGLENILTSAVIEKFEQYGRVEIIKSEANADSVLKGIIKNYHIQPILNNAGRAAEYRIEITAAIMLRDEVKKETYWRDDYFHFSNQYELSENLASSIENKRTAWEDAGEDFAESIVSIILEGF